MNTATRVAETREPMMISQYLQAYFAGIDFPAHREDLVRIARLSGATADELHTLQSLPNRNYSGVADIRQSLALSLQVTDREPAVA